MSVRTALQNLVAEIQNAYHRSGHNNYLPLEILRLAEAGGKALNDAEPPTSQVPEGWQLVPVEPNEEMKTAGNPGGIDVENWTRENFNREWARATYKAMLAAAPKPPK